MRKMKMNAETSKKAHAVVDYILVVMLVLVAGDRVAHTRTNLSLRK